MQLRPDIQIATMVKALTDVIIPAIPEQNRLAAEQARLLVGMLGLMRFQLPRQFRFDRDELIRLVSTADSVAAIATEDDAIAGAIAALEPQRQRALDVLARCQGDPAELEQSIRELRTALCALVDSSAAGADEQARERIEAALLAMSAQQLLRERALVKPQNWEADAAAVPAIDELLDQ